MKVEIAFDIDKARNITFQSAFPETAPCCRCGSAARLAFVAHEFDEPSTPKGGKYVCHLYNNDPEGKGYWLHDACCIAIYLCRDCLEPTALYNQA